MFDKDITIINKYVEITQEIPTQETEGEQTNEVQTRALPSITPVVHRETKYKVSHVKGFWSSSEGISINNVDLIGTKQTIVRILCSETGYVEPKSYTGTGWTLKNDDYVVKGGTELESVSTITDILENYECLKITNVAVKDYGSSDMWHYEISGE